MSELLSILSLSVAVISLGVVAVLLFFRQRPADSNAIRQELREVADRLQAAKADLDRLDRLIREDSARARDASDERGRQLREEVTNALSVARTEAQQTLAALRDEITKALGEARRESVETSGGLRTELTTALLNFGKEQRETLEQLAARQRERLDVVTTALTLLTENGQSNAERLREAVERGLSALRDENTAKLEQMRQTVDEKLQTTLNERLGANFQIVSEQLQKVSVSLGEMQQLAAGVGDLKRVLTQVKPRGVWGEAQLASLLDDFLAPDQFARNVAVNPQSQERVEFAIRLPRLTDAHSEVYLAIDAKFPHDSFERVVIAAENGNAADLEEAARALERAVRQQAKDIATKYIFPPNTTDYAVMFLPSEGLYAEIARRPGLIEGLTREYSVMVAGPSTLTALLNAIRVGFRSALIHRQAGEIAKLLQRVRSEFEKYGEAVQSAHKRAQRTVDAIAKLQTRQNVMGKALRGIDLLSADTPIDAAAMMLEMETRELETDNDENSGESNSQ